MTAGKQSVQQLKALLKIKQEKMSPLDQSIRFKGKRC